MSSSVLNQFRDRQVDPRDPALARRDEQLNAYKEVVGRMGHDFNNYLAPLLGYAMLIKEETALPPDVYSYAEAMERALRRAEESLQTILVAARPHRRFQPQHVDFKRLVLEELKAWEQNLPENAGITVTPALEAAETDVDVDQWRWVVRQLLANARYALAMGGTLSVALRRVNLEGEKARDLGIVGERVFELVFKDNGIGIGTEALRRVFEPFYSTRPKGQAAGLGLTIVHSVVRWHGGQVNIESREDEGTTVTLWWPDIPVHFEAVQGEKPPPESSEKPVSTTGKKVLVVDDDPLVLEVIRKYLQKAGYEVTTASDGDQGWRFYQRAASDWRCVISDVTMPGLNGIELAQRIRQKDGNAKVILISGDVEATRPGALAVLDPQRPPLLKKPFSLKQLLEVMDRTAG